MYKGNQVIVGKKCKVQTLNLTLYPKNRKSSSPSQGQHMSEVSLYLKGNGVVIVQRLCQVQSLNSILTF